LLLTKYVAPSWSKSAESVGATSYLGLDNYTLYQPKAQDLLG